jgi:hypothetical protein
MFLYVCLCLLGLVRKNCHTLFSCEYTLLVSVHSNYTSVPKSYDTVDTNISEECAGSV